VLLVRRPADGAVWLERRPPAGIWGGLWSPPEYPDAVTARAALTAPAAAVRELGLIEHAFTHFDLTLVPVLAEVAAAPDRVGEGAEGVWYNPRAPQKLGLPAPIATLLASLPAPSEET
jgi:A/G-specific adenine glycosylase